MRQRITAAVLAALALATAATSVSPATASAAPETTTAEAGGVTISRFLGQRTLPNKMDFGGTVVGGFSGMDRDPLTGTWYFLSDDRWRYNPARFYEGRLTFDRVRGTFDGVEITAVDTLTDGNGDPYPGYGKPKSVDPEGLRFDPISRRILWSQEGDRPDATHDVPLSQESIQWATTSGGFIRNVPLPRDLDLTTTDHGVRRNTGIEAIAVTATRLAAIVEGPRYEDGEPPTVSHGSPVRMTVWNRLEHVRAQYIYEVDTLPTAPVPADGIADSGVSEMLAIDATHYLTLERTWLEGVGYRTKLYEIDLTGATDVQHANSVKGLTYTPVKKRLVYDFADTGIRQENLESMSWGPHMINGERTLVVASDDNFSEQEVTQFLAFTVKGA